MHAYNMHTLYSHTGMQTYILHAFIHSFIQIDRQTDRQTDILIVR